MNDILSYMKNIILIIMPLISLLYIYIEVYILLPAISYEI